ncbi:MAG: hypothetical protein GXO29_07610 [Thermotogae bacterium]|nr:hypothetical protein [Thermotogota bacterium]
MRSDIEELLKDNEVYRAYREAERRLRARFSKRTVADVVEALGSVGDVKLQRYYIELWKERGDDPDYFVQTEAYINHEMCDSVALRRSLRKANNLLITADIVASYYGRPDVSLIIAGRLKGSNYKVKAYGREYRDFILDLIVNRALIYMGLPTNLESLRRDYGLSEFLMATLSFIGGITSGEFERHLRKVGDLINGALAKGDRPVVMSLGRYRAFVELDAFTLELLKNTYEKYGSRYNAILSDIFLSFLTEKPLPDASAIPHDCGFLRTHYDLLLKYREGRDYTVPDRMAGMGALWWYVNRRKKGLPYLSFSGKLRLYDGVKEIRFRSKRVVVALAFLRLLGREFLEANLHVVFPGAKNPKRRLYQALAYLGRYRYVPTDARITIRAGNFLRDEDEPWAILLKERMLNRDNPQPLL